MKITKKKVIAILMAVIVAICLSIFVPKYMQDYSIRKDVWNQLKESNMITTNFDWKHAKITKDKENGVLLVDFDTGLTAIRAHVDLKTHRILSIDSGM